MSNVIGEYFPDGTTKTEADTCALTGRPVLGLHSVLARISNTPYFYRYLSDFDHLLTPQKRAAIEATVATVPYSSDSLAVKRKGKDSE